MEKTKQIIFIVVLTAISITSILYISGTYRNFLSQDEAVVDTSDKIVRSDTQNTPEEITDILDTSSDINVASVLSADTVNADTSSGRPELYKMSQEQLRKVTIDFKDYLKKLNAAGAIDTSGSTYIDPVTKKKFVARTGSTGKRWYPDNYPFNSQDTTAHWNALLAVYPVSAISTQAIIYSSAGRIPPQNLCTLPVTLEQAEYIYKVLKKKGLDVDYMIATSSIYAYLDGSSNYYVWKISPFFNKEGHWGSRKGPQLVRCLDTDYVSNVKYWSIEFPEIYTQIDKAVNNSRKNIAKSIWY